MSLTGQPLLTEPEYILADIRNRAQIHKIFSEVKPDIVFHAAAYKQLPLLEKLPENAIRTNVIGTSIIAEECVLNDVDYLVNISTDKAASPTSILGLTKRITEMIVASYANDVTRTASVRFGNVLGSKGSFVETLHYQAAEGLPITITDPNMCRYFMTIPEAAGLVIEVLTLANHGSTYVLDMGEPIKITDLVDRYAELMDIKSPKIIFTGARKGEKLAEELFDPSEEHKATVHPKIREVNVPNGHVSKRDIDYLMHILSQDHSPQQLRSLLEVLITAQQEDGSDAMGKKMIEITSS
jgi:FlaA1/EpsC-like NDP-sugar epimerase